MLIDPGPYDLDRVRPLLRPDGSTVLEEITTTLFREPPR